MSQYSAAGTEDQMEEEEEFFDDLSSSSSNSGSVLVDNLLAGITNNPNNETQIDSALLSHSSIADVSVFPSKVRFPTSFPNIELKQKLLFSNSGMIDEHFRIQMTGDLEFYVEETEIDLPAGNCYSLFVTFLPKTVSLFQASLIFEGRNSIVVTLLGHCVPSPLDFPSPTSSLWKFPNSKSQRIFPFTNRSFSINLDVDFSINSPSITVDPMHLSLDPGTSDRILVSFDPSFVNLREDPSITIKCPKSGDDVTIPLQFIGPRSCTIVDFGAVAVGASSTQTIQLKSPQIAPLNIDWPFSITNADENGIEQSEFTFSFSSKRPGAFRQMLTFDSFDIELKAKATDPPFALIIPKKYPNRPLEIRNTADRTIVFKLLAPKGYIVDINEVILRPKQTGKINVISESGISGAPEIIIIWDNSDGRQVTDHVPLPRDGNSPNEQTEIDIIDEPSGIYLSEIKNSNESHNSTSISKNKRSLSPKNSHKTAKTTKSQRNINSPNSFSKTNKQIISNETRNSYQSNSQISNHLPKYRINNHNHNSNNNNNSRTYTNYHAQSPSRSPVSTQSPKSFSPKRPIPISSSIDISQNINSSGFVTSPKFIPFFGVSYENPQDFELTINAPFDFSIVAPEFVALSNDHFSSNVPFTMTCNSSPQSENTDYLKVMSKGQIAMNIPIISYRSTSFLEFNPNVVLNNNKAIFEVRNNGERAAFLTFALNNEAKVTVTPLSRILNQYESQKFVFTFESDPETAGVTVIYGDEIIRQIKAELRPNEFYSTMFRSQKIRPELTLIKDALFKCDRREIASITRKYIQKTPLRFLANNQLTFSPASLSFTSITQKKRLIISNIGIQPIKFNIYSVDDFVKIKYEDSNNYIKDEDLNEIPPNSQIKLTIQLFEERNTTICISCGGGNDLYEIPIEFNETSSILMTNTSFSVSKQIIDFGKVEIGIIEESNITVSNHLHNDLKLSLNISPKRSPFKCPSSISVAGNSNVTIPIEFIPTLDQEVEAILKIENRIEHFDIHLIGEGITTALYDEQERENDGDGDNFSTDSDSDCVVFPKCEPGILRRAKVRVTNRTNKIVQINAVSSPPFICPIDNFQVDMFSYVWFPVHFLPKSEGIYEGSLEFKSDNGKVTIVMLKGICE
ncbi:hypothetical protein TRFO_04466 [Tritrichomonas foetus]|uniref:Cep192-like domain-containing protein n=1 Tax=Tritrichomonas foetus TaxID=1144522 RepID=A0A1J4KJN9_9EUKA|nr:hypothetical protein TRFO_04466 [Tritrichomonas foetus]|eukprot:OHT09910.1 hypothetical protein TRFO_04466 [Tritrichomonas foetus]